MEINLYERPFKHELYITSLMINLFKTNIHLLFSQITHHTWWKNFHYISFCFELPTFPLFFDFLFLNSFFSQMMFIFYFRFIRFFLTERFTLCLFHFCFSSFYTTLFFQFLKNLVFSHILKLYFSRIFSLIHSLFFK